MNEINLKQLFVSEGFHLSEDDSDTLYNASGISVKFYSTSEGVSMFNVVDTTKPKYKWMYLRFRVDFVGSSEDLLYLLQGATVKGF